MTTTPQRLFIDGEWTEPADGHYEVVDPATEETVGFAPEASRAQVCEAAAAARDAFATWSRTRPEERAAILDRAADLMQRDFLANAALAQAESGATTGTARGMQVAVGAARFRRYAKGALEPVEEAVPPQINEAGPMGRAGIFGALAVRQPVGVVTCITSYNNPWANPAEQDRPSARDGQHGRRETGPAGPALRLPDGRGPRGSGRRRRASSTSSAVRPPEWARPRSTRRTSTWSASPAPRPSGSASPRSAAGA